MSKKVLDHMLTPEFDATFEAKIKKDKGDAIEWRRALVKQANDQTALKGISPDARQLEMQKQFVAAELEHSQMIIMIRELSARAEVPLASPTPHDMGLD